MWITTAIQWIVKNKSLVLFGAILLFIMFLSKQCSDITSLKEKLDAKDNEIKRIENNHLAEIDTIKQSYDSKTGVLTASIKGYELTLEELDSKYSSLFSNMAEIKKELKNSSHSTVTENNYYITEKILGVDAKSTALDSAGSGKITFSSDTIFSEGNSRKISGEIPYKLYLFNKSDSSIISYSRQPFYANITPNTSSLNFTQEMTIFTGVTKNKKTGQVSVWAKTNYPGVTFNVLKGATIEDDKITKAALVSSRKTWGLGFSFGLGEVYNAKTSTIVPGIYFGVGVNFSPKKLQFGK